MISNERIADLERRLQKRRKPDREERAALQVIARLRHTEAFIERIREVHAAGNLLDMAFLLTREIPESGNQDARPK